MTWYNRKMRILKSIHTVERFAQRQAADVLDLRQQGITSRLHVVRSMVAPGTVLDQRAQGQEGEITAYNKSLWVHHGHIRKAAGRSVGRLLVPHPVRPDRVYPTVMRLNEDPTADGVLVYSPVHGVDTPTAEKIFNAIAPDKDMDGSSEASREAVNGMIAGTALATAGLLKANGIDPAAEGTVVTRIGRGRTVGAPLGEIHAAQGVEEIVITHRNSKRELDEAVAKANIVVSATGVDDIVEANMLRPGHIVVGVGRNDIAHNVYEAGWSGLDIAVTDLGGVGPLTSAMEYEHTIQGAAGNPLGGLATLELVQFGYEQMVEAQRHMVAG